MNLKLTIAYYGGDFLGWQKTPTGPSIEAALEEVLEQILQEKISLQAASRTDAGVHATGQVVNFFTEKGYLDLDKLLISLNQLLPKTIAVLSVSKALETFHPTLDCIGKEYHYDICIGKVQMPQQRLYSWHVPYTLDLQAMREAASHFVGEHDFSAFCNFKKNSQYTSYIRCISTIEIEEFEPQKLRYKVVGNHFLYKMVRNIVGTLVYVGRGKISVKEIPDILSGKDRTLAGVTAPAHGLTLARVQYATMLDGGSIKSVS